ncbi:MAG: GNAT family N-acetyltransferase [Candidatus Thorarchaeota archaeon]
MVTIRRAELGDIEAVLVLANTHGVFDSPLSEADLQITRAFPDGFIIAEHQGTLAGVAIGYIKDVPSVVLANWNASMVGQVELLVVNPHFRRHGIGRMLMEHLLNTFSINGVDMVTLYCPAEAIDAKSIYDRIGFTTRAYAMWKRL